MNHSTHETKEKSDIIIGILRWKFVITRERPFFRCAFKASLSRATNISGQYESEELKERLYGRAVDTRMLIFRPAEIYLVTWDRVLDLL